MGVEMQNCPLTRVFVKRASTGLLLFQWIYVSPLLSLCHSLVSRHPSLSVVCFHHSLCMCFSIFILSLCMPLNHIFLLLVSCRHYFHSTACTCKPLLSLYHSGSLASFLLFTGLLIFRAVADPRNSGISAKSREIPQKTRNTAKSTRNISKYMSAKHI